jgi:hypothetical protein
LLRFLKKVKNRNIIIYCGNGSRSEQVVDTNDKIAGDMGEVKINYGVFLG